MKNIKKYNDFINEDIRQYLKPKSPEDIKRDLMKLSPDDKMTKGTIYNLPDLVKTGVEESDDMELKLRWACQKGYIEKVKELLKSGVDPNTYLALSEAVKNGHIDIVEILLKSGADPHANMDYCFKLANENGKDSDMVNLLKRYSKNNK